MSSVLQELGPQAVAHRDEMEQVKKRLQIHHDFFDCWIYGFLENKKFDVDETVSKLQRREAMERNELANYDVTDYMRETMAKGIIQLIGEDKEGRVTFYIVTRRDYPTAKRREENKRNFDMWLSYGTRLRHHNKKCRITMLINQKDASMWSNTDMTFQADVALRIAKYYPGAVDRMYITKMSNTLATMAKPIFSRLPAIVSDRIRIFTESDIEKGKLLELFDANVLPKDLGGTNDCDGVKNWTAFATTIENHFTKLKEAVGVRGLTVKEWELETLQRENAEALNEKRNQRATQRLSSMRKPQQLALLSASGERGSTPVLDAAGEADAASDAELKSCFSGDDQDEDDDGGRYDEYGYYDGEIRSPTRAQPPGLPPPTLLPPPPMLPNDSVAAVMRLSSRVPHAAPHLRFFFDEERRWRHAITMQEAESRLVLCDRRLDAFLETENAEEDIFGSDGTRRLAIFVPAPARSMLNFFLQCCCVLSAVYFAAATVFCTAVVCSIAVTFFFGMFAEPLFVFPVGMCFLLMAFQGAMVCSRGVELTRRSYYGRLLPGFRSFGSLAQPIQLVFTFTLLLIQFIIFVVYAVRWDTLNGLKVAFATGWLSCSILIALHHIFFWLTSGESDYDPSTTGSAHNRKKSFRAGGGGGGGDDASKGALPIYLLFDLTEDDEEESTANRTSGLLLVTVPVIVSLLLGVAFLTTKLLALAVAVPLATITAAWALNVFVDDSTKHYHAVPAKFLIWFAAVAWMFDCYTFGFREYSARWASPVITISLLTGVFLLFAVLTHRKGNSSRVLRLVLLLIVGYSLACVVMTFVAVRWSLGVFAIVMVVHAALCVSRNFGSAITIAGRFLVAAGIALVLIAAVMLGWSGTSQSYSMPRADNSSAPIAPPFGILTYTQWERTPLCALFLDTPLGNASLSPASTTNVSVIPGVSPLDVALLVEVSNAATAETFEHDVQRWFGNGSTAPTVDAAVLSFPTSLPPEELPAFTARSYTFAHAPVGSGAVNVTILVLQSPYKLESIKSMMIWVEAIALSPLSIFLPSNWTSNVIRPYSFSSGMIPFRFHAAVDDLRKYVAAQQSVWRALFGPQHQLYLTGEGVGGGLAALTASLENIPALAFNAPGLSQVLGKFGINEGVFLRTVTNIHAVDAALSTIGGSKPHDYSIPCGLDADTCQSIAFLTAQLIQLCEPSS